MKSKSQRIIAIKNVISQQKIKGQDELLDVLLKQGFSLTQATLSRDLKQMMVIKQPDVDGVYCYTLSTQEPIDNFQTKIISLNKVNVGFSGNLAVVKTRPGYAASIASEIDLQMKAELLGSVAGDDTILLIPKEGIDRATIIYALKKIVEIQ